MKQHLEMNLKFNGNLAFASNSFSKALQKFDKETSTLTCSITGDICPLGQYADCNVCDIRINN